MKRLHIGVLLVTILIVAGGLLGYNLVRRGFFPVALVNGKIILYNQVKDNVVASERIISTPGLVDDEVTSNFLGGGGDLFLHTFDSLIKNLVIKTSASKEEKELARSKIENYLSDIDTSQLSSSIKVIYNWDFSTFRERILEPQALDEVLVESRGEELDEWLSQVYSNANVSIWFLPFEWEEEGLVIK